MGTEVPEEPLRCAEHGRATRLTCVTCGRPICPECLVQTPVGFKCGDDARGSRIILVRFKPARPVRSAASIAMWTVPYLILLLVRLATGFGAGLGAAGVVVSILLSLMISIGLSMAIRYWMTRR